MAEPWCAPENYAIQKFCCKRGIRGEGVVRAWGKGIEADE